MENSVQVDSIIGKQKKRYALLRRIYELSDGDELKPILLDATGVVDLNEVQSIIDYLDGEGLVESLSDNAPLVRISHRGVVELEESVLRPKSSTEHFLSQVIQHFHGNVGSVQTGNQNIANVSQELGDPRVLELLQELRSLLNNESPDARREGSELLDGLEAEVKAASPSESRIKLYLRGLGTFVKDTGKDLLVEIGSRLATNQIGLS